VRISHYELLQPIGRDGATEIYRARDLRLDREVAIKLLRPEEMARPGAIDRFHYEARIASLVSHPHVCAVHESGEENGQPFIVCELLEGRALDEVIGDTALSGERLLDIGFQLADALVAIHRRGLIHGNLKPSNVFITNDGHVKLLELGAAGGAEPVAPDKVSASDASRTTGAVVAVPRPAPTGELFHAYLAPEQIAERPSDHRADIFAAGALLYEMATGRRAFAAETPAQIAAAITSRQPPHPRKVNPRLPAGVGRIIVRALEKDPDRRYQSAGELFEDLRRARQNAALLGRLPSRLQSRRSLMTAAIVAASVLVIGATVGIAGRARGWWTPARTQRSTVLVSQIANGTGDPDFDGTLREAVTVYLAQSPSLDLVSDERIRGTLQLMGRDGSIRMTHDTAQEVCQRLGLQAMLEGSVSAVGRTTVVALAATDCATGATIERRQVDVERKEDVLRAMGTITAEVREALGESRSSLAQHNVTIEEATTPSLDALKAYTEATTRRASGRETEAIPFFERAIALDPRFALAYTNLSTLYGGLGETGRSEELARQAYDNRGHVSERERLFITYQYHDRYTGDQTKARETLDVWKRTYPRDYRPANALAVLLNRLGDYDAASEEAREAIRRNPEHAFPRSNLAYALRGAGKFGEARRVAEEALARNLGTGPLRRLAYQLAELENDEVAARVQLDWATKSTVGFDLTGARAQVAAFRGRMSEARRLYAETIAGATAQGYTQIASGYGALAALTEALYGYDAEAIAQARRVLQAGPPNEPRLRAATALALADSAEEAEPIVRRLRHVRPEDTLLHTAYLPVAEAALLLRSGVRSRISTAARGTPAVGSSRIGVRSRFSEFRDRADAAIEQLRPAAGHERGIVAALVPAYLRGEARLLAGDVEGALREFRVVLDHRGADPFSPVWPLSQLGLARALAELGRESEARQSYDALLHTWSNADPDLPLLVAAQNERGTVQ
jgi:serine/threonine protein kinase/Tfp pilus assembly protein PilF